VTLVVGIDIAKEFHWATVVAVDTGKELISRRVGNDPDAIAAFLGELAVAVGNDRSVTVGIDVLGGIAGLVTAMVLESGYRLVHVPGLTVNRARHGTRGGEHKSDPRDARVIADQLRIRDDWRLISSDDPMIVDLGLLVSRRRDLVTEQTRRINRTRDLMTSFFPGLEKTLDLTNLSDLHLLSRYATPSDVRRAGRARIVDYLRGRGVRSDRAARLAESALAAARTQQIAVTGEARMAGFVREFAGDALITRTRLAALDAEIAEILDRHPDAALIRSMPGMGATLTAEFLSEAGDLTRFPTADALAAASGLAPVLQQSGKTHYLRRATGGAKSLKEVFYRSAFCALQADPASKAFYARKRAEGKGHQQAVIALARRRVTVLHAILRTRQPYQTGHTRKNTTAA
jgi:transposase